jgi:hypothetical protein
MKKKFYVVTMVCLLCNYGFSQNFYVKPYYGTAVKALPNYYTTAEQRTIIAQDTIRYADTYNYNSFSLGEGNSAGISFGRYYNDSKEGIEGTLSYFSGKKQKLSSKDSYEFDPYSSYYYSETWIEYYSIKTYNFTLTYFRQFYTGSFSPFFKAGGIISYVQPTMEADLIVLNTMSGYAPGKDSYYYKYKLNSDLVPGFFASAGIELFSEKTFSVVIEGFFSIMSYKPKKMTCQEYTINDTDELSSLSPSTLEIIFVDSYISTENENENRPTQLAKRNHSLSGKGLQFGVKYRF